MKRLKRLVSLLLVLIVLLAGVAIYATRTNKPSPACLRVAPLSYDRTPPVIANPQTGQIQVEDHADSLPLYERYSRRSPDGNYLAHLLGGESLWVSATQTDTAQKIDTHRNMSFGWASNGSSLGFIYLDDSDNSYHIGITNPTGSQRRTNTFSASQLTSGTLLTFGDWSADGSYISLVQYDSQRSYFFVSTRDLQLSGVNVLSYDDIRRPSGGDMGDTDAVVSPPPESPAAYLVKELAWAPHGNRFAYLIQTPKGIDLVVATPDRGIERTFNVGPLEKTYPASRIHWSPDGRYIAIHTREHNEQLPPEDREVSEWWYLYIFGVDGVAPSYKRIPTEQIIDPLGLPADVGWVGGAWVYRHQRDLMNNDPVIDAIAFYPDQNRSETLATNTEIGIFPNIDRRWFAIPIQRGGKADIEVMDIKGQQRRTLLKGAPSWIERIAWSPDGAAVLTVFSDGAKNGRQYRIAWMSVDSPDGPFTSDKLFPFVEDVQWLADRRTALVTSLGRDKFSIHAADLRTGELFSLINDVSEPGWKSFDSKYQVFPSPTGRDVMFLVREFSRHKLYIASLDQHITRFVRDDVEVRNPRWSPDGTQLAFLQIRRSDNRPLPALETISADGSSLHRMAMSDTYKSIASWGLAWTWCP